MKPKQIVIIGSICVSLLIIIVVSSLVASQKNPSQPGVNLPIPTAISIHNPNQNQNTLTPTVGEDKQLEKEINLLENRQPMNQTDAQTKTNIIALQQPNADAVYATDEYQVLYIRALDEFQVEITTLDVQKAKTDATAWFASQGMSHDGICKLPLTFITSPAINRQLKDQEGSEVSPLADGC